MITDVESSAHGAEDSLKVAFPAQPLFREAVIDIAERAKGVLPECHDRIERAVQLLLSGEVQALLDGTVQVRDPEQEGAIYHVQDTCPCPESAQAPRGWCAHRLAGAIAKRASALVKTRLETPARRHSPSLPFPLRWRTVSHSGWRPSRRSTFSLSTASRLCATPVYWPWRTSVGCRSWKPRSSV